MQDDDCFTCRKHLGREASPPGGYIYEDGLWMVCHAPVDRGALGTLFMESKPHTLDFAEFNDQEAASFGMLLRKIYGALRPAMAADRIHQVLRIEGISHFHAWILPRMSDTAERGIPFLAEKITCANQDAVTLAIELRETIR